MAVDADEGAGSASVTSAVAAASGVSRTVAVGTDVVAFFVAGLVGTAVFVVIVRSRFEVLQMAALASVVRRRQRR